MLGVEGSYHFERKGSRRSGLKVKGGYCEPRPVMKRAGLGLGGVMVAGRTPRSLTVS